LGSDLAIKLGAVGGQAFPKAVKHLDRQAARIVWRLHHDRRHGGHQHQLCDAALAVTCDIAGRFASAGGMANVNSIVKIEMFDDGSRIGCVVVHVMAFGHLT
jgi:hypothetical protein